MITSRVVAFSRPTQSRVSQKEEGRDAHVFVSRAAVENDKHTNDMRHASVHRMIPKLAPGDDAQHVLMHKHVLNFQMQSE